MNRLIHPWELDMAFPWGPARQHPYVITDLKGFNLLPCLMRRRQGGGGQHGGEQGGLFGVCRYGAAP